MSHQAGELLDGRYRLGDRIASGGMGDVWQGTDVLLNRAVAVKTLRDDRATDPHFHRRFQNEARVMAALHHPGIADVYDFGRRPGDPYLVMAFVHGQPLDRRLAGHGRIPVGETMAIVAQVARALQAAHDVGIVHRDVKPGNIIVQPDGTAVLVDFGIAHSAGSADLTATKEVLGTPHYLAPERLSKQGAGPAADLYALGAVAYHCLAGQPPFTAEDTLAIAMQHLREEPPRLPPDIPAAARDVVTTALAKDPADRFPSAATMADAAQRAAGSAFAAATTVLRPGRTEPPEAPTVRLRGRHSKALMLVLVALALVAGFTTLAVAGPFGHGPGSPVPSVSVPAGPPSATPDGHGAGGTTTRTPASPQQTATSRPTTPAPTTPRTTPTTTPPTTPPATTPPATTPPTTTPPPTTAPVTTAPPSPPPATTPTGPQAGLPQRPAQGGDSGL
ncbi:serine/threonine protein kinase [Actinoplanes sp. LDG1-06]|uniref:non-specific serine/threonine protein kinase n=1 Tax=Paractinoplanes ovalisporus TaxID=2810368 RepID=A0ABS2A994_9ACTN|nr:serine/threonine-protein kinase [Actinoplanes ovalisporus]MBM2616405.1 serine/threonine protein kinase [Actinoplanes ovalisporus]